MKIAYAFSIAFSYPVLLLSSLKCVERLGPLAKHLDVAGMK